MLLLRGHVLYLVLGVLALTAATGGTISARDKTRFRQGIIEGKAFVNRVKQTASRWDGAPVLTSVYGLLDSFDILAKSLSGEDRGTPDELRRELKGTISGLELMVRKLQLTGCTSRLHEHWKFEPNTRRMDLRLHAVYSGGNTKYTIGEFIRVYENFYDEAGSRLYYAIVSPGVRATKLLETMMECIEYDRKKMATVMDGLIALLIKAAYIDICYERFNSHGQYEALKHGNWYQYFRSTKEAMTKADEELVSSWRKRYAKEADDLARKYNGRSHQDFANNVFKLFQDKYYWRNWFVLSYDAVGGWDKHTVGGADTHHKFRFYGRNFFVGSTSKSSYLNKNWAYNVIHDRKCHDWPSTCRNHGAQKVYGSIYTVGTAKAVLYSGDRFHGVNWSVAADGNHWMSKRMLWYKGWLVLRYYTVIMFG